MSMLAIVLPCAFAAVLSGKVQCSSAQRHRRSQQDHTNPPKIYSTERLEAHGRLRVSEFLNLKVLAMLLFFHQDWGAAWTTMWHGCNLSVHNPSRTIASSHPDLFRCHVCSPLFKALPAPTVGSSLWKPVRCADFCMNLTGAPPREKTSALERRLKNNPSAVVQIDAENVRGKSGFLLNHAALLAATAEWTSVHGLRGRVLLVIDHGAAHEAFYLQRHGIGVVFAGPKQKADPVISHNSWYFSSVQQRDVIVITRDSGLRRICKKEVGSQLQLHLATPAMFLKSLFLAASATVSKQRGQRGNVLPDDAVASELRVVDEKVQRTRSSAKRAKLLRRREQLLQERPGDDVEQELAKPCYAGALNPEEVEALEAGMAALQTAKGNEKTGQRELLAERLRCQFLETSDIAGPTSFTGKHENADEAHSAGSPNITGPSSQDLTPVFEYVKWLNSEKGSYGAPIAWRRKQIMQRDA